MMFETVEWDHATYFTGRNGTFDQTGIEVSTDTTLRGCKDPEPQLGIVFTAIGNRGVARCVMSIPFDSFPEFERAFKKGKKLLKQHKKELKDAQGKVAKTREPVAEAGTTADPHQHGEVEEVRDVPVRSGDELADAQS